MNSFFKIGIEGKIEKSLLISEIIINFAVLLCYERGMDVKYNLFDNNII